MPDWGEIFADPEMQRLAPNPEVLALLPEFKAAGLRLALDAGSGAGRHLLPLAAAGFEAVGVDLESSLWPAVKERLAGQVGNVYLVQADLRNLPFPDGVFDLALSINVINHGYARDFQAYCWELERVLKAGGHLLVHVSPREFGDLVRLPQTEELEPGTLVDIDTPDGSLVHHFPTPEELEAQFPGCQVRRLKTVLAPIPFMQGVKMPQLVLWGEKKKQ